jgi:hypothetical protein
VITVACVELWSSPGASMSSYLTAALLVLPRVTTNSVWLLDLAILGFASQYCGPAMLLHPRRDLTSSAWRERMSNAR